MNAPPPRELEPLARLSGPARPCRESVALRDGLPARIAVALLPWLLALTACSAGHDRDGGHADDHAHEEDGHAHGDAEEGGWTVTAWGDAFEIFAEAGPLIAGEEASA